MAATTDLGVGGNDAITTGNGSDIVFGGFGADTITTGIGNTTAFGDDGQVVYSSAGVIVSARSINPGEGGNDTINVGAGTDVIIGGVGDDTINGPASNGIIIGDDGLLMYSGGVLTLAQTSDPSYGGQRRHHRRLRHQHHLGGSGADSISAGTGNDIILGDNGQISYTPTGVLVQVMSTDVVLNSDACGHLRRQRHHHRGRRQATSSSAAVGQDSITSTAPATT